VVSGIVFVLAFLFWPYEYRMPFEEGHRAYVMYTPIVGGTVGLSVLALSFAMISYVREFFPDELSVQQRHDGPSDEVARATFLAQVTEAARDTGIGRRRFFGRGAAAGVLGVASSVAATAVWFRLRRESTG
jgi:ubiquinol-cytochrome c reductase iron-sulfur subunit